MMEGVERGEAAPGPTARPRADSTWIVPSSPAAAAGGIEYWDEAVVLAYGARAVDGLFAALKGRVPELILVGDAMAPRLLHDALLEGTRAARRLPAGRDVGGVGDRGSDVVEDVGRWA